MLSQSKRISLIYKRGLTLASEGLKITGYHIEGSKEGRNIRQALLNGELVNCFGGRLLKLAKIDCILNVLDNPIDRRWDLRRED